MGRYRAPGPKSSPYITADGHSRLKKELKHLWREKRPRVTKALAAAAAEGDRSENAEYTYRKKQLGEIDRRVRYLAKRLDDLQVVDKSPADTSRVYFGAWIRAQLGDADPRWLRLVGADEAEPSAGYISIDSPLATAFMKRQAGEVVVVKLPDGPVDAELLEVQYGRSEA